VLIEVIHETIDNLENSVSSNNWHHLLSSYYDAIVTVDFGSHFGSLGVFVLSEKHILKNSLQHQVH